ncbi:hypothetical protein ACHAPJ_005070 [Fusarium lateritium]
MDLTSSAPAHHFLRLDRAPFKLEHLEDYEPGGHHPIHLRDTLGEHGRYHVIHKLGNGGFANVWLCRDMRAAGTGRYVAVKVLIADVSPADCAELKSYKFLKSLGVVELAGNMISLPLDHFQVSGPNGTHVCLVYPVLGPQVHLGLLATIQDPDKILRDICLSVVRATKFLHGNGLCHGDITPSNILHHVQNLDGLSEEELIQILGNPVRNPVVKLDGSGHDEPSVPQYLIYPVKWENVSTDYISRQSCLVDFGESFVVTNPPEYIGIPGSYRAPELILENSIGCAADLWALGCTLFEIRTGRGLYKPFDDDDDSYLIAMVEVLGILPEPWWSSNWEDRRTFWKDEPAENGLAVHPNKPTFIPVEGVKRRVHPSVAEGARSLKEKLAPGVWYIAAPEETMHRPISEREMDVFADLLGRLLRFSPEDRESAASIARHEWFKM